MSRLAAFAVAFPVRSFSGVQAKNPFSGCRSDCAPARYHPALIVVHREDWAVLPAATMSSPKRTWGLRKSEDPGGVEGPQVA